MVICQRGLGALLFPCIPTDWPLSHHGYGERYVKGSCTKLPSGKFRSTIERAHVVALERKLGRSRRPGAQANHHCDNRACIQPQHLYEGTQIQNIQDMHDRKRAKPYFATGLYRVPRALTEKRERELVARYIAGGVTLADVAAEFGVSKATASRAARGRVPHSPRVHVPAEDIRRRYAAGGVTQRELAAEFGVSPATVSNVITRRWHYG
jgi:transposase-like protein